MSPDRHLFSGIVLGTLIYSVTGNRKSAAVAAVSAVACDSDHVLEYACFCYKNHIRPSQHEFFSGEYFAKKSTIWVVFHGYEYLVLMLFILAMQFKKDRQKAKTVSAIILGYGLHLMLDLAGNDFSICGYSLIYRIMQHGNEKKLCSGKKMNKGKSCIQLLS